MQWIELRQKFSFFLYFYVEQKKLKRQKVLSKWNINNNSCCGNDGGGGGGDGVGVGVNSNTQTYPNHEQATQTRQYTVVFSSYN